MQSEPITPPVPQGMLAALEAPSLTPAEAGDLTLIQSLIKADKAGFIGVLIHAAIMLEMYFGLHLTAAQIAILGSMIGAGVTFFLGLHFSSKPAGKP